MLFAARRGGFAAEAEAFCVAEGEGGKALGDDGFSAEDGASERFAREVPLGGPGKVVVPDVVEGSVETDALEAVVKSDGPAVLAGERWEGDLGEVFEVVDGGHGFLAVMGLVGREAGPSLRSG